MLNENDINNIYGIINSNHISANKYVPLPFQYNNKKWKWEGKDFPRVMALLEFKEFMVGYEFERVLTFGGTVDPEFEYLKYKEWFNYEEKDYDLHNFDFPDKDFDFCMINQTIEHLYDPLLALKNIYRHLRIGGMFYANVPANNIPHCTPHHYFTGITPMGLGAMIKLAGFDILKIGQWGNIKYFKQMFDNLWSDYTYSNNPGYNDINCPIITWCLAVKK